MLYTLHFSCLFPQDPLGSLVPHPQGTCPQLVSHGVFFAEREHRPAQGSSESLRGSHVAQKLSEGLVSWGGWEVGRDEVVSQGLNCRGPWTLRLEDERCHGHSRGRSWEQPGVSAVKVK